MILPAIILLIGSATARGFKTLNQLHALAVIHHERTITVTELSRMTGIQLATITCICDWLEQRGYIRRSHGTEDRRTVWIDITDSGADTYIQITAAGKEPDPQS